MMGNRKLERGVNDLATTMPEIAAQWDYEKNGGLTPEDVRAGSSDRVWWKCERGHSWQTAVYHRKAGHGCPFCTAAKVRSGVNDLGTVNPALAREWDYDRNEGLSPSDVTQYSQMSVWWKCERGHSWKNVIAKRTKGQNCPYCSGNRVWKGFNDLVATMPEIALQWDSEKNGDLTPEMVSAGSEAMVWWKCQQGHSWKAVVYSRKAGNGCPYCAGNAILPGYNDLRTKSPELLAEWDYEKNGDLMPEDVCPNSNRFVWWRCSLGHSWKAVVYSRSAGKGCPYCAGRKVMPGFNDLASKNPQLASEWDKERNALLKPSDITVTSHRQVWWKGSCGHSWRASPANRSNGNGCPYCAGRRVLAGFNDLETIDPVLAMQWDYEKNGDLTPHMVTVSSNRKVWWRCGKNHSWKAEIADRANGGCPYCSNRRVLYGYNDLLTIHPDIAAEWDYEKNHGLKPEGITYRSDRKVWWRCSLGHSWKAPVYDRHSGVGCPFCKGKRAFPGFNDLKTVSPQLVKEWDYERNGELGPEDILPYTNQKVWWKCENGHHWKSIVNSRQKGVGCPYCAGLLPKRTHIVT